VRERKIDAGAREEYHARISPPYTYLIGNVFDLQFVVAGAPGNSARTLSQPKVLCARRKPTDTIAA